MSEQQPLPRTRTPVTRLVPTDVDEVRVAFTLEQVRTALITLYGQRTVGPEATKIPQTASIRFTWAKECPGPYDSPPGVELVWDEPSQSP
jgi:hypothetical protein